MKVRRIIAAILLAAQAACMTSPRPVASAVPLLTNQPPKKVWLSLNNGEQLLVERPQLHGDSLAGITRKAEGVEEVWLPMTDVREVKTRQVSGLRTALLIGIVAVAAGGGILLIPSGAGQHVPLCTYDCDDNQ